MIAADLVTVDPVVLAPALLPALGAVLVLVGDAVLPGRRSWQPLLGVVVLAVAAGTALATGLRPADDPVRTLCLPGARRRLPVDGRDRRPARCRPASCWPRRRPWRCSTTARAGHATRP